MLHYKVHAAAMNRCTGYMVYTMCIMEPTLFHRYCVCSLGHSCMSITTIPMTTVGRISLKIRLRM